MQKWDKYLSCPDPAIEAGWSLSELTGLQTDCKAVVFGVSGLELTLIRAMLPNQLNCKAGSSNHIHPGDLA